MEGVDALSGLVIEKVDKIAETKTNVVEQFLRLFLSSVGIEQENQPFFFRKVWFKLLVAFFLCSVSCQIIKCFYLDNIGDVVQTVIFIFHSLFLNFNTFSIYWKQKYILELVNIKVNYFSGFYEKSLVMRNYMTADDDFRKFMKYIGTGVAAFHFFSSSVLPFCNFLFSDIPIGSDETFILPSWFPWEVDTVPKYLLTYLMQLVLTTALMLPSIGNFFFIIYFVYEILIQKANLCTSLNNIVVYAYWESMGNESSVFQMLASSGGQSKSYDDLLYEYLQDCIKHHILINSTQCVGFFNMFYRGWRYLADGRYYSTVPYVSHDHHSLLTFMNEPQNFIQNFIECYDLVFLGCLAYSVGNLSLIMYSIVLLRKENARWTTYITPLEGALTVLAFLTLYCYLGEVVTSINNAVRQELYEIKWYEQSLKYQSVMQTFMCLTQRDIYIKAGVTHVASYAMFASVLRLTYSFFNLLYTSV